MRHRRRTPLSPLPQRNGIDAVRVRLPQTAEWDTVRSHLLTRLAAAGPATIDALIEKGGIVTEDGTPITATTPFKPGAHIWFHREMPPEPPVPFPLKTIYRDAHILIADKPHFLATTPRGSHVTETALARLRRETGLETLSPAHRLDRLTAGLVLFVVRPEDRGRYQTLFRDRKVTKEYEAVARHAPNHRTPRTPLTIRSRIEKHRGTLTAQEIPHSEPNAETTITLASTKGPLALYRLTPHTGRTHQLRVHMNSLGTPILGDPLYPHITAPTAPDDYRRPLQLLARTLEFRDPLTNQEHRFVSDRTLGAWESYETWAQ
ncbi:pseudouridine synthase [Streptomyces sp. NPDC046939]|uniref:pseudouridine synthase n=1 Tax=Streptomyces sp. NPDC046939 TaxID=3155376 RepID=UPI0033DED9FA